MITRPCAGCGKTFRLRASSTKQYCSPACYNERAPKNLRYKAVCATCGKEYWAWKHGGGKPKYCSDKCRGRARYLERKEQTPPAPKPKRRPKRDILSWSINRLLKEGYTRYCPQCLDYYQDEAPAVCPDCHVAIESIEEPRKRPVPPLGATEYVFT